MLSAIHKNRKFVRVLVIDALTKGIDYLLLPVLAAMMGEAQFGIYSYIVLILAPLAAVLRLGFETSIAKLFYDYNEVEKKEMMFSTTIFQFAVLAITGLLCFVTNLDKVIASKLITGFTLNYSMIRIPVLVYLFFYTVQITLNNYFIFANKLVSYQIGNFLRVIFVNVFLLVFLKNFSGDIYIKRLWLEPVLGLLIFVPLFYIFARQMIPRFKFTYIQKAAKIGYPVALSVVVTMILNLSDKYFIQQYRTYEELGVYNLAALLCLPVSLIFSSFHSLWIPKFFSRPADKASVKHTDDTFKKLLLSFAGIMVLILLLVYASLSLGWLPGVYTKIITLLPFLYVARVFDSLSNLYNNFIIKWEKTIVNLVNIIVISFVAIGLNFLVVPRYGIVGAAVVAVFLSFLRVMALRVYIYFHLKNSW